MSEQVSKCCGAAVRVDIKAMNELAERSKEVLRGYVMHQNYWERLKHHAHTVESQYRESLCGLRVWLDLRAPEGTPIPVRIGESLEEAFVTFFRDQQEQRP